MPETVLKSNLLSADQNNSFAARLRNGPMRSIIDRILRNAADDANVSCMVLGICHPECYELLSTHGVPITHYRDRFPISKVSYDLFDQELEIDDLQNDARLSEVTIAPFARSWCYGASVPIRMRTPLPDGGRLVLSCADTVSHISRGKVLGIIRNCAELISDLVWLSAQLERAVGAIDPNAIVEAVLQAGISNLNLAVCIVNEDLRLIAKSQNFVKSGKLSILSESGIHTNSGIVNLMPNIVNYLEESWRTNIPSRLIEIAQNESKFSYLDIFPLQFSSAGKFAILSVHNGDHAFGLMESLGVNEVRETSPDSTGWSDEGPGPVSRFLLETLVAGQRLNRRGDVSYISLRKWRAPIKAYQISALKALKADIPDSFVTAVAEEMVDAVRTVYGDTRNCVIVPVPCGSSGAGCLASRLATRMARILDIPVINAFAPIEVARCSSHPRRNIKRPKMNLMEKISQPVILVDDVTTSGSHLCEAASLLRINSTHVWPITWIGS